MVSAFAMAQPKESDFFRFSKDGEKYLKLVKYVYFDSTVSQNQKISSEQKICFIIDNQRFLYTKKHRIDSCSLTFLQKIKLSKPSRLNQDTFEYFKKIKNVHEKKMNNKTHILFPIKGFENYVKVYVLEKINNDKLLIYEVDWEYSEF